MVSSALMSALLANGIKPGDKVIVPAFTFVASCSIPKMFGAEIIVADVDRETLNVNPKTVENLVKNYEVKFVIIVDIGGLPVDIESFIELSKKYNFILIEDAAQSFGSEYKNKKLGSFDHITIFSFQIAKQLTTIEGGCVATTDLKMIKKINQIKDYGRNKNEMYVHDIIGTNFRTTDLQSAIGLEQFKKIDNHILTRNKIADEYKNRIKDVNFQKIPDYVTKHSYMLFFAMVRDEAQRNKFITNLNNQGIDARKSWTPIHMQPCNPELHEFSCPIAEQIFKTVFTLPIYNDMSTEEAEIVIEEISSV